MSIAMTDTLQNKLVIHELDQILESADRNVICNMKTGWV